MLEGLSRPGQTDDGPLGSVLGPPAGRPASQVADAVEAAMGSEHATTPLSCRPGPVTGRAPFAVSFMDSSGLRAALHGREAARSAGVAFRLAVADGAVRRLFDTAGVWDWFDHE